MIIKEFEIFPFKINLKEPFINSNVKIINREGFLIKVTDELGNTSYGEVSPLPGSSIESVESIRSKLLEFKNEFVEIELDSKLFNSILNFPSMSFGVSQALHSIFIMRNGYDPELKFNQEIIINGVVGMVPQLQVLHQVEGLIAKGFKTIKIKIGRDSINEDINLIRIISASFDKNIRYRFDANGCWSIDEVKYFIKELDGVNVEYLEQPVKTLEEIIELSNFSIIPIAADESIREDEDVRTLLKESSIEYFVLKPSIMGTITDTIALIKIIENTKRKVIISSAFETPIGRSALVFLAAQLSNKLAHGLGVANIFIKDIVEDLYPIINAKIRFDERTFPPKYNIFDSGN